jgi:hypothetical protein
VGRIPSRHRAGGGPTNSNVTQTGGNPLQFLRDSFLEFEAEFEALIDVVVAEEMVRQAREVAREFGLRVGDGSLTPS